MNNDLLNSPNKNPKEFNNTNIVYKNNDIKFTYYFVVFFRYQQASNGLYPI